MPNIHTALLGNGWFGMQYIRSGRLPGVAAVQKFGLNPLVGIGTEDVWDGGGTYVWQDAARSVEVLSSNTNDTAAGSGARTIEIQGLDADYNPLSEIVSLNGITAVDLTSQFLRIFRAKVLTVGSLGTNLGQLTVRVDAAGDTMAIITIGSGQTNMALYTVKAGHTAYIFNIFTSASNNSSSGYYDFEMRMRSLGGPFSVKYNIRQTAAMGAFTRDFISPIVAAEKTDIIVIGTSTANNSRMICGFDMILSRNS